MTIEQAHWSRQRLGEGSTVVVEGRPAKIAAFEVDHSPDIITLTCRGGALRISPNDLSFDPRISVPAVDGRAGEPGILGEQHEEKKREPRRLMPSMRTLVLLVGEAEVERALELAQHIDEVETGYKHRFLREGTPDPRYDPTVVKALLKREEAKLEELKDHPTLAMKKDMFRKYRQRYKAGGWDAQALISGYRTRNRTQSDLRLTMVAVMREIVLGRVSRSKVTMQVVAVEAWLEVQKIPGFDQFTRPEMGTIRRWINQDTALKSYFANTAKTNQSNALKPEKEYTSFAARVTRPGEAVMIDTWEVPVRARAGSEAVMNVRLVLAIDVFTRSLLAWRFVPAAEKSIDIALLLGHMLTPEPMRPHWEETARFQYMNLPFEALCSLDERLTLASAKPIMLPETIYIDNGKPYAALAFRLACQRLGISIQPSRIIHPTDKAIVEASFKAIQSLWAMVLQGFKGDSVVNRGLDPDAEAVFWPEHLHEMFTQWACTAWQYRSHRGLSGVPEFDMDDVAPQQMYELGIATSGFVYYPITPATYLDLLPIHRCSINDKEVTIEGRKYRGPILVGLGAEPSPYGEFNGKWPVAQDPHNITLAYIKHPLRDEWHVLKWQYADIYGVPMSDYRYRTCRLLAAKRIGNRRLNGMDVVQVAIEIRDGELARLGMSPNEATREAALDAQRVRMAPAIPVRADGTVGLDSPEAAAETSDGVWDVAAEEYPDDDPYVQVTL